MPKFNVDVKAFISVAIEADNEARARELADSFVESLSPSSDFICGYNGQQSEGTIDPDETGGFDIDGVSEVEDAL